MYAFGSVTSGTAACVGAEASEGVDGVNRIGATMLYVHVAEAHHRELPEVVRQAVANETDPDTRILRMLAARGAT